MKCLALDTSTPYLSLAISDGEHVWFHHQLVGQKHSEYTLQSIDALLQQSGLALTDLEVIIFGQGPGSFTGLRIACGIAQGLGLSTGINLMGIPTLDSIVAQLSSTLPALIGLDARMGQIYYACYQPRLSSIHTTKKQDENEHIVFSGLSHLDNKLATSYPAIPLSPIETSWQRLGPINVGYLTDIALPLPGFWLAAGNGITHDTPHFSPEVNLSITKRYPTLSPHAYTMIQLARTGAYPLCHPREAEPLYIRDKVALTSREQRILPPC